MTRSMMTKLKEFFSTRPVEKAWIFGSYARGEETPQSDVDILVKYMPDERPGLFGICDLIEKLESLLGKKVDLVEEGTLYPRIRKEVDSQKIIVYERNA